MRTFLKIYAVVCIILGVMNFIFGNVEMAVGFSAWAVGALAYVKIENLEDVVRDLKKKLDM